MFGVGSRRQRTVRGLGTSKTEATVAESAAIPAELNSHGDLLRCLELTRTARPAVSDRVIE